MLAVGLLGDAVSESDAGRLFQINAPWQKAKMFPAEIKTARQRLGLTQQGLAETLRLGPNGERTIRRWERGDIPVTGPASLAIELLLKESK